MKRYPEDFNNKTFIKKLRLEYGDNINQDEIMDIIRQNIFDKINEIFEKKVTKKNPNLDVMFLSARFEKEIFDNLTNHNKLIILNEILERFPITVFIENKYCINPIKRSYPIYCRISDNDIRSLKYFYIHPFGTHN